MLVQSYLQHLDMLRSSAEIPLIGSINVVTPGAWTSYARNIAETGVDAIELNIYAVQTDLFKTSHQIEEELFDIISGVVESVDIPVAFKMSPYYTSVLNIANHAVDLGVSGLVFLTDSYNRPFRLIGSRYLMICHLPTNLISGYPALYGIELRPHSGVFSGYRRSR